MGQRQSFLKKNEKKEILEKKEIHKFLSEFLNVSGKVIDEFDFFSYDGLLNAVPLGKLFLLSRKKIIQITDLSKALHKALELTFYSSYILSLKELEIDPVISKKNKFPISSDENNIIEVKNFDLTSEGFHKNQIVQSYLNKYIAFTKECKLLEYKTEKEEIYRSVIHEITISEANISKLEYEMKSILRTVFFFLLEDLDVKFGVLSAFLKSGKYSLEVERSRRNDYHNKLRGEFINPHLQRQKKISLKDIYIRPNFLIYKYCFKTTSAHYQEGDFKDEFIEMASFGKSVHEFVNHFIYSTKPIKGLRYENPNVLVLLGSPGQGKSSFCKKIMYDILSGNLLQKKDVFFIKLKDIIDTDSFFKNPLNYLIDQIIEDYGEGAEKSLIMQSIIILDGLDELYITHGSIKDIDITFRKLLNQVEKASEINLIVTSRIGYLNIEDFRNERNLILIKLKEFSVTQQLEWLEKYRKQDESSFLTPNLLRKIHSKWALKHLKELISQPILLQMLAQSDETILKVDNKAEMYNVLFTILIDREYENGQLNLLRRITKNDLRSFVRSIALNIFQSGRLTISNSDLISHSSTKVFIDKIGYESVKNSLKGVLIAFYFSETKTRNETGENNFGIEFMHKSFMEYMTAEKIWQDIKTILKKNNTEINEDSGQKSILVYLHKLFSPNMLSEEVIGYLYELIDLDSGFWDNQKERPINSLISNFSYLMKRDFNPLGRNEFDSISRSLNTFYGVIIIMKGIKPNKKIFLEEKEISKFTNFIKYLLVGRNSKVVLKNIVFSDFKLNGADFSNSNLSGCAFNHTEINSVHFMDSNLSGSDFERSICIGTSFKGANLSQVNFRYAKLTNCDFREAIIDNAVFYNAEVEGAIIDDELFQKLKEHGVKVSAVKRHNKE